MVIGFPPLPRREAVLGREPPWPALGRPRRAGHRGVESNQSWASIGREMKVKRPPPAGHLRHRSRRRGILILIDSIDFFDFFHSSIPRRQSHILSGPALKAKMKAKGSIRAESQHTSGSLIKKRVSDVDGSRRGPLDHAAADWHGPSSLPIWGLSNRYCHSLS